MFTSGRIRNVLNLIIFFTLSNQLAAQTPPERLPHYTAPYEIPNVDSIRTVCNRIASFWNASGKPQIIDRSTGTIITDFSKPNQNAGIPSGFANEWSYTHGVVISAYDYLSNITGDKTYSDFNVGFFDFVFDHLPYFRKNASLYGEKASGWKSIIYMEALDDCGSIGCSLIKTYMKHKDERYRAVIDSIANFISNKQFRLKDGTLARRRPQAESIWADDLYMSVPFLAQMGYLTKDKKYYDDAVKQVLQITDRLFIKEKGILDHGWNAVSDGYDPRFYWGRANGWNLMSMAELLSVLPEDHPGRIKILTLYRTIIRSIAELQDGTGLWHNLLDKNDTYLETSCSAMFVYAIARGINEGWINEVYGPVAQAGWNALTTRVWKDGQVDGTCEATTFANDNVYYYHRGKSVYASHGYGPVLYAGAEMIRLLQNKSIGIKGGNSNSINSTFHYIRKK
jgi:unsaturated rhamnogalacturonyl hydrolase